MKHLNLKISGRVQGVGFRWAALKMATKLKVSGFATNLPDGRVYIEAEGEENNLEEFIQWCRKGSWFAKVAEVQVEEAEAKGYNAFVIKN